MPRVVKRPEERRNELLDRAQELFFERGYDQTTVNDIIEKAGVSKGAFYHHFSSKEEMLEALAARLARESVASVGDVLGDASLDALGRLNAFLGRARQLKVATAPKLRALFDVVFRPENIVLYHRLNAAVGAVMAPVLARIIGEGVAEGVFDTPDPRATAEILLQLGTGAHDAVARAIAASSTEEIDRAVEELERRLRLQGIAFDRILGVPDGSVRLVEPGFARAVMSGR
jgi:AcrR family transcriptional regulator